MYPMNQHSLLIKIFNQAKLDLEHRTLDVSAVDCSCGQATMSCFSHLHPILIFAGKAVRIEPTGST